MLDINYIKESPAEVIERLAIKGKDAKEEIEKIALADEKIAELVSGKEVVKIIVIPNKLVNIVVK